MNTPQYNKWLHRYAVGLACATLFLIFAGGMVTSTGSSLSVPDWPLSYGQLMPPMVGGIFYEHGHRMIASGVGFLTILLVVFFSMKEQRKWMKKLAWLALGLVILQGLLGGLTVLLLLPPPISIFHACLAQTFFTLIVAITLWTSKLWFQPREERNEPPHLFPLHKISAALFGVAFVQLILGAVLRHTGHGLVFHITGAFLVAALASWACLRILIRHAAFSYLKKLALVMTAAVYLQLALGFSTYFVLNYDFPVIPMPMYAILIKTFHVVIGAFVLGCSVYLVLLSIRTRPQTTGNEARLGDYFELTKPGITITAGVTALAGFILGSKGSIDVWQLLHTAIGTLLISAGACTLNMVIEKDVDSKMKRTQKRPLPSGKIQSGEALFIGVFLSVVAIIYLGWAVNLLTAFLAGVTMSVYIYIYTPLKKVSAICTPVGAIAGGPAASDGLGGRHRIYRLARRHFVWDYFLLAVPPIFIHWPGCTKMITRKGAS